MFIRRSLLHRGTYPPLYNAGIVAAKRSFAVGTSKKHSERRLLKYSAEKIYGIVANVEHYKEFVPWCIDSKIISKTENAMSAELTVGYSLFKETYRSEVELNPNKSVIAVSRQTNLFDFLRTEWSFQPARAPDTCWVTFNLEFQFKSMLYNQISELFFDDIVNHMVAAFERRCKEKAVGSASSRGSLASSGGAARMS